MESIILFVLFSVPVIIISWRTLFNMKSHGFYRFLSWECIILLFVSNYKVWFQHPFSIPQIISWVLLFSSIYLVIAGAMLLKKSGKPRKERDEDKLYAFEKTSTLVETGIYKYIKHPMYASLLFLTWGIYFKDMSLALFIVAMLSTICLYLTAKADEEECIEYFGPEYIEYMKYKKMFIPFIF